MHITEFLSRRDLGRDRRIEASFPAESTLIKRTHCPSCNLPAVAPLVSTYLAADIVENRWTCSACGFEWNSRFDGLFV